jgi:carbamoyltransferase
VLQEFANQYFELRSGEESPYMLLVAPVKEEHRLPEDRNARDRFGIEQLNQCRSVIPAVTHVDYSARIQTIDSYRNPLLHKLLAQFHQLTGCPVMINTSFNVRSEPIVCSPLDAYRCFMMTEMDTLVLGKHILQKSDQPIPADPVERDRYLKQFELD